MKFTSPHLFPILFSLSACGASSESVSVPYGEGASMRYAGSVIVNDEGVYRSTGSWKFWYPDGTLQARGKFEGGAVPGPEQLLNTHTEIPTHGREGTWEGFVPGMGRQWKGQYREGKREGLFTFWFANGQMRLQASFKDDLEEGEFRSYFENGDLAATGAYDKGRRSGHHAIYGTAGQLLEEGDWDIGQRVGLHRIWDDFGILREEGVYRAGHLAGLRTIWDEGGNTLMTGTYYAGKPNGQFTLYYPTGKKKSLGVYKDGAREGVHVGWSYAGDKIYEVMFENGEPNGVMTTLYAGGEKRATQGELQGGLPVGTHAVWSDSGKVVAKARYHGTQKGKGGAWQFWKAKPQTSAKSPR
ncbi:MAG: toxin-antitoxin system YwqK family antitoxin [bacterium]|nr:toxin-antitoxin system YwqK family antitoxin [bacterium]